MSRRAKLKLKPNLDNDNFDKKLFNLTVLRRVDPSIDDIMFTTPQVAIYQFDIDSYQWGRKDVDGPLFVVKRNSHPRFQFIIMNRQSTENLVENLVKKFEFDVKPPYILYKNECSEVKGIWFYSSCDSDELSKLLTRILGPYSKIDSKPQITSTNSKLEELEKVPTTANLDGPLEPVPTTSARTDTVNDSTFVNFFSAAMNIGDKHSTSMNRKYDYQSIPSSSSPPFSSIGPSSISFPSQRLISSPHTPSPLRGPISTIRNSNSVANLVKPSSFFQPPFTSPRLMTPTSLSSVLGQLNSPMHNPQLNHAPAVLPFPPPTLQASPASNSNPQIYGRVFNREKVRNALLLLAKDEHFIDIVYQALLKAHNT